MNEPKIIRANRYTPLGEHFLRIKTRHRSLLGIFQFQTGPGIREIGTGELLKKVGLNGWEQYDWASVKPEEGYIAGQGNTGGYVTHVKNGKDEKATIIFLERNVGGTDVIVDAINTATVYHEEKHVYQFENNEHRIKDGFVDMELAELEAHQYACKMLMFYKEHFALAGYILALKQQVSSCLKHASAANRFIESPEYQHYEDAARPHIAIWSLRILSNVSIDP